MNLKTRILFGFIAVLLTVSTVSADAFFFAPSRITTRYETLNSIYIPNQLNDVRILYFSDLHYGLFMDDERLDHVIERINALVPDVIIFGGDIFDQSVSTVSSQKRQHLTEAFAKLKAPLGKFAVFGDTDRTNDTRRTDVEQILYYSDFEILQNTSIKLRNLGSQAISITGLDSMVNGTPDVSAAFANISPTTFNIVVAHTPDQAATVPTDLTNYFIAGHSFGGQAYFILRSLYSPEGAEVFLRGKHNISDAFTLDISSGVGTTASDVRFLSNTEIVLYRLQHKTITGS